MTKLESSKSVRSWQEGDEVCPRRLIRLGQVVMGRVTREVWLDSKYPRPSVNGVLQHARFAYIVEWLGVEGTTESNIFFGDDLVTPEEAGVIVGHTRLQKISLPQPFIRLNEFVNLGVSVED